MAVRQSIDSEYAKTLDTAALRREFLIDQVFVPDALQLTYSHVDRIVVGGAFAAMRAVEVPAAPGKSIGVDYLPERRAPDAVCSFWISTWITNNGSNGQRAARHTGAGNERSR